MGIVYLAKDPVIGRLVALKTIRTGGHTDDEEAREFQQRFVREAQAAGILNHPSIVTVHDIGQDEATGTSFIAMEYVEGQNLKDVLQQGRPLSFDDIAEIVAQVADALDFAHAKGIVHRDVKPANIILLDDKRAKITDFGIAKIASGAQNLTTTGQFLGTPNYMAPEQIKGAPVDGRTDIFSLGICLYECLTRRKPFGGDSLTSISYKIVHETFPPLQGVNPQIPGDFEEVVAHALAKDPSKRYQRAGELAGALRAVVRGEKPAGPAEQILPDETILTRSGDEKNPTMEVPYPGAAFSDSTRPATSATAARAGVAGAAPAGAAPSTGPGTQTRMRAAVPPSLKKRIPAWVFAAIVVVLIGVLAGSIALLRRKQVDVPAVDTAAEAMRLRERTLREEANTLLQQGRINDAYAKFEELQRIAPQSPFVETMLQRLNAAREQEAVGRQQITEAQQKFDEGVVYFNARRYPEAIDLFQEAVTLNPKSTEAAEYLRIAQMEELKARLATEGAVANPATGAPMQGRTDAPAASSPTPSAPGRVTNTAQPAQLTTVFNHNFTDGRIVVRIGGDIVVNEPLFTEKPGRLFRKADRTPRQISVMREFPAKNADVQVWVMVPAVGIQEHNTLRGGRFDGGSSHRLVVAYDESSRRFSYQLD
jgi:hypothetical protein